MFKIGKETELQQLIIDTCITMGGFGFKLQDKYTKGKPDLFLKLPSGVLIFAEVKVVRRAKNIITPEFTQLQLDWLGQLTAQNLPAVGLIFMENATGTVELKISEFMELKKLQEQNNRISFHVEDFIRVRTPGSMVQEIDRFFYISSPQIYVPRMARISCAVAEKI